MAKVHKCEFVAGTFRLLWNLHSQTLLNQGTKHSQPVFEEAWLKILTCCTHWIFAIHTSARSLWSFQHKPEKAKKLHIILCVYLQGMKYLRFLMTYIHAAFGLCWQFRRMKAKYTASVWRKYIGTPQMCSQTKLDSVGQTSLYPVRSTNNIHGSECISFNSAAVGLNKSLKS